MGSGRSNTPENRKTNIKFKDLIGKTIASATVMKNPEWDDEAWLKLTFADGTSCVVTAGYGGYTGNSEDEYPAFIGITDDVANLVPVEEGGGE